MTTDPATENPATGGPAVPPGRSLHCHCGKPGQVYEGAITGVWCEGCYDIAVQVYTRRLLMTRTKTKKSVIRHRKC